MTNIDNDVGIIPKNPTSNASALDHVLGGFTPSYDD